MYERKKPSAPLSPTAGSGCDSMSAFHQRVQAGALWVLPVLGNTWKKGNRTQGENFLDLRRFLRVHEKRGQDELMWWK